MKFQYTDKECENTTCCQLTQPAIPLHTATLRSKELNYKYPKKLLCDCIILIKVLMLDQGVASFAQSTHAVGSSSCPTRSKYKKYKLIKIHFFVGG